MSREIERNMLNGCVLFIIFFYVKRLKLETVHCVHIQVSSAPLYIVCIIHKVKTEFSLLISMSY